MTVSGALRKRTLLITLALAAVIVPAILSAVYLRGRAVRGLPYRDAFASADANEWSAFGGTWQISEGAMRNDSDERGAKLMTGSPYWKDYSFTSDLELLGKQGDAGLILRSSDEEPGVDSYRGYYVGLRSNDGSLVIGRADYGWIELATRSMPGGVHAFQWYHLKAVVNGCRITGYANEVPLGPIQTLSFNDPNCIMKGRVGLRSHSSGGVWKGLVVQALTGSDPQVSSPASSAVPVLLPYAIDDPVTMSQRESGFDPHDRDMISSNVPGISERSLPVETIGGLRSVRTENRTAMVRGTVILNSPRIYVQDATGGVAVMPAAETRLKVGDEVEVTGQVEVHDFSCIIRHARLRLLWAHAPAAPLAVTPTQAATGAFDSRFIEVDGSLAGQTAGQDKTTSLAISSSGQSFNAIVNLTRGNTILRNMTKGSLIRLRGVCVVDPQFTHNLTPFVLLVASSDDVEVLAGPPWWSVRNLAISGLIAITLSLLAYLLYLHARHWRLRAIVDERERIAHEMHDTLAQSFVGIGFQLQAISNNVPLTLPNINQQLDLACELVRHSHEEATRSLSTLRREFLELETLHSALHNFASRMVEHGTISVQLRVTGEDTATPYAVKDALFRIGQEAISNSLRHGNPSLLQISFDYAATTITMVIEDNGIGFDQTGDLRGFGLTGIRKRAQGISGVFHLFTGAGQGTRIEIVAPLPPRLTWLKANRLFLRDSRKGLSNGKAPKQNSYSYRR
ncbi:two-component system sensor kinase [Acidisarcina polymorpha]|uniref:Two-component system sensor kinase n=1 Tax=Acidisarcina polymorpha TaxID=2211140 RepID=A0A2Z5G1R7_9BACT|nr:histidine kinase [Acidisarcina polymorpha]AXC12970.1 two-component system sensor kinase [Acidisarcina polymorpha]